MSASRRTPRIRSTPAPTAAQRSALSTRGLVVDFFSILLDLRFTRYLTVQLLPVVYVLLVLAGAGVLADWAWQAWQEDLWRGAAHTVAYLPALLIWATVARALTEFLLVVFRMSQDVQTLASIKPSIDRIDGLFSGTHWMSRLVPFIKAYQNTMDATKTEKNNRSPS